MSIWPFAAAFMSAVHPSYGRLQTLPLVSLPTFCVNSGVIDEHRRLLCWTIAYTVYAIRVSADVEQQPCDVFVTCLRCQHQRGTPLLYKHSKGTRNAQLHNVEHHNTCHNDSSYIILEVNIGACTYERFDHAGMSSSSCVQ
jgi:hypothetical protein